MPKCSYCNHTVSYDATFCPSCGKQKPASSNGAGYLVLLGLIAVVYLTPALLINKAMGRFEGELVSGSLGDGSSWIFSTFVWATLGYYLWMRKK